MTDPHSKSNFQEVVVKRYDWKVEVDFSSKKLSCSLTLHAKILQDGCTKMVNSLDHHHIQIMALKSVVSGHV